MSRKKIWEKMKSLKQKIDIFETELEKNRKQSFMLEKEKKQKSLEIQKLWLDFNELYRELQEDKRGNLEKSSKED